MSKPKIRVLLVEPMEHPKEYHIEPSMRAFRKAVNVGTTHKGKVEAKKLEHGVYAIFNKDSYLSALAPNRQIGDDIIVGTMLIVAIDEDRIPISMMDEQMRKYALRFWHTESFDEINVMEVNMNTFLHHFLKDEV